MSVFSAQFIVIEFTTRRFDTGTKVNADNPPTGVLVVNGVDNAAVVVVTNLSAGRYVASVTLPTLANYAIVEVIMSATVNGVADQSVIFRDSSDLAEIQAKTDLIGAGLIILVSPVAVTGTLGLIRGDDYFNADGRALEWTDFGSTWPALAGATIHLKIYQTNFPPAPTLDVLGAVIVGGPPSGKVRAELTKAQTALLTKSEYNYFVVATLADTHVVTLVTGLVVVTGRTP